MNNRALTKPVCTASDSYEKCLLHSSDLFGRARVMLVAELVCFQNLLRKNPAGENREVCIVPKANASWSRWRLVAKGWSNGSVVFFCLSSLVVVVWAAGEMAGHFSGDQRYGNSAVSLMSILVNVLVFAAMMAFLSFGAAGNAMSSSQRSSIGLQSTSSVVENQTGWARRVQRTMLGFMGSSQGSWERKRGQKGGNEWRGRVHHLQSKIDKMRQESNERSQMQAQAAATDLAATELRLRNEFAEVTDQLASLQSNLLLDMKQSQERALNQIQSLLQANRKHQ
jgi:hypothetical protein